MNLEMIDGVYGNELKVLQLKEKLFVLMLKDQMTLLDDIFDQSS